MAPKGECNISGKARVLGLQLICYTSGTIKICPNPKFSTQLAYIVTDTDTVTAIVGGIFNIFITFPNVYITFPIAVILIMGLYSH